MVSGAIKEGFIQEVPFKGRVKMEQGRTFQAKEMPFVKAWKFKCADALGPVRSSVWMD